MKALSYAMTAMLLSLGVGLFVAAPVAADCDTYGNEVDIGSTDNCTVNKNYCDGDAGPAGSGAGGAAGIGVKNDGAKAEASANAGSSTSCDQCAGSCSGSGGGDEEGLDSITVPEVGDVPAPSPDYEPLPCGQAVAFGVAFNGFALLELGLCN